MAFPSLTRENYSANQDRKQFLKHAYHKQNNNKNQKGNNDISNQKIKAIYFFNLLTP